MLCKILAISNTTPTATLNDSQKREIDFDILEIQLGFESNGYKKTQEICQKLLDNKLTDMQLSVVHHCLGRIFEFDPSNTNLAEAEVKYRKAIELNPENSDYIVILMYFLKKNEGDPSEIEQLTCRLTELNNIYWNKTYGGHFKCGIQPKEPNLIKMHKLNKLLENAKVENAKANPKESKPFEELAIFYGDHIHTSHEINLSKDDCIAEAGKNAILAMKLDLKLILTIIDFLKERQT